MALAPKPFPEAVPTAYGWAHPVTGEQLTAGALTAGQLNGETPVAYYRPNQGNKSFIDPTGATENLIQYRKRGRRVHFAVQSRHKISSVAWTFGNSQSRTGGPSEIVKYTAAGPFAVSAVVTFDATQQRVNTVTVGAGGTGYVQGTTSVVFSAPQTPGGTRATGTVTVTTGAVTAVTVTNKGSGYTSAPTVTINGAGTGATATATIQTVPNATLNIASLAVA